jgi:hypothetical protein
MMCRRKWLRSLSISVGQELWLLRRRLQMMVLGKRRRWPFLCGVMDLFVFNRRRSLPFPRDVLELWDLSRRRRRPFPHALLELWVLTVLSRMTSRLFMRVLSRLRHV